MTINIIFGVFYGFLFSCNISFAHVFTNRVKIAFYEKSRKDIAQKWKYVLSGRSQCDHCHKPLNPFYIIPLLGYFFSGGKCRKCHQNISPVYVIEEWVSFFYGSSLFFIYPNHLNALFMLIYFFVCYFLSQIDRSYYLIPMESLFVFFLASIIEKFAIPDQNGNIILLLSIPVSWYLLLHLIDKLMPGRLGMADIHYIVILTFAMGFPGSIFLPTVASFLAIFYFFIVNRHSRWESLKIIKIPFGLFLSLAFLILKLIPISDIFN